MRRRSALLACALLALATTARAEVWVFVDEAGVSHFAPTQVDPRYTLYFRGRSSLDPPPAAPASPSASELLRDHPTFKRVSVNPDVGRLAPLVEANAKANRLDPALVSAVIAVESAFDPAAVSPKGAIGLMQVLPATAERYGVTGDAKRSAADKLAQPAINIRVGTRYLRDLMQRFDGDLALVLAAYNAGELAVDKYSGTVPPYPETQEYVRLVQQFRDYFAPLPAPVANPAPATRVTIDRKRAGP